MIKKLFDIVELGDENNRISQAYDLFMMITIILSLVPLAIKENTLFFVWMEKTTTVIFIIDYILRWFTADLKLKKGKASFVLYPFSPMAIIDILSVLPSIIMINGALRVLKVVRLIKALRVLKVFRGFRYLKNMTIIANVLKKQKRSLTTVCFLAVGYIFLAALVIFNVEPETFNTYFDAVYWATVSLTTVGYGDIYSVSVVGKLITMISALLGIAIVALPAGIITAGYMSEIKSEEEKMDKDK